MATTVYEIAKAATSEAQCEYRACSTSHKQPMVMLVSVVWNSRVKFWVFPPDGVSGTGTRIDQLSVLPLCALPLSTLPFPHCAVHHCILPHCHSGPPLLRPSTHSAPSWWASLSQCPPLAAPPHCHGCLAVPLTVALPSQCPPLAVPIPEGLAVRLALEGAGLKESSTCKSCSSTQSADSST